MGGICKILSWDIASLFGRQTISVSCSYCWQILHIWSVSEDCRTLITICGKFTAVSCRIWQTGPQKLEKFKICRRKLWSLPICVLALPPTNYVCASIKEVIQPRQYPDYVHRAKQLQNCSLHYADTQFVIRKMTTRELATHAMIQ